jgi:dienelactone hydrolase
VARDAKSRRTLSRTVVLRRRVVALCTIIVAALVVALVTLAQGSAHHTSARTPTRTSTTHPSVPAPPNPRPSTPRLRPAKPPFAVAEHRIRLVDRSRGIRLPDGTTEPRTLVTYVRYPTASRGQAAPRRPLPLIVFGHGYTLSPAPYAGLLDDWTRAGYVVAAPVFPLENGAAPGGPNESDLVNQPRDLAFVISRLLELSASRTGPFSHLIDPTKIAVAGHSDGGETALAVAYDRYYLDPRVRAAMILSGAKIPGVGGFDFPPGSPPLLAIQGTADDINPPSFTRDFYDVAQPPKYLLQLLGAGHLSPYTGEQPQLGIVDRVTLAFLDRYLKGATRNLGTLGNVPGVSTLTGQP